MLNNLKVVFTVGVCSPLGATSHTHQPQSWKRGWPVPGKKHGLGAELCSGVSAKSKLGKTDLLLAPSSSLPIPLSPVCSQRRALCEQAYTSASNNV